MYTTFPFYMMVMLMISMSTLMSITSTNWLFMWLALEINMLCFIPLILITKSNKELEATIKYFLLQALGSSIMLISSLMMWHSSMFTTMNNLMLMSSLLIKLGAAPLHFWYPSVMASSGWFTCLLLSSWQKLAPLLFMMYLLFPQKLLMVISMLNALLGGLLGLNQSKLRSIMAYSSLVHMGWIGSLIFFRLPLYAFLYFLLYTSIIIPLFSIFSIYNMNQVSNTSSQTTANPMNMNIPVLLLSLSGIPPLIGFLPKWMTMYYIWSSPQLLMMLVIGALLSTFYYMNILFTSNLNINMNQLNLMYSSSYIKLAPLLMMAVGSLPMIIMMI